MPDENVQQQQTPEGTQEPQQNQQQQPPADGRAWVPEKLKGHKSLEKFKSPEDALNAYVNLESAYGKKFEENLKDDAAPEVKSRIDAVRGVPASPAEYDEVAVPEGFQLDAEVTGSFRELGHKARLTKSQYKTLTEWVVQQEITRQQRGIQERAEAEQKGMEALKQKWGPAATRNIALCQQVVAEIGGRELADYLNESGMTNDPRAVEFLAKIGARMQEDKMITPNPVGLTADDAKAELQKIRSEAAKDKKHPYLDRNHPDHKRVVARVHELTQLANPEP